MSSRATSETLQAARLLYELTRRDEVRVTIANRPAILRNHSVGSVRLPSGKLCACDPITSAYDAVAFERQVAPGTYPVDVFVAEFEDNDDQRVAAALVHLASARADDWEDALWPGQDASTLGADGFYGYPVDAGTGCFASPEGLAQRADVLSQHYDHEPSTSLDPLSAALEATYIPTWGWADFAVGGANVIAFHSGFGDGTYPTCWGLDSSASPVCALTDFLVIDANATSTA